MNMNSFIGESKAIKKLSDMIPKLAKSNDHILLIGERGSGKSTVAKLIHYASELKNNIIILNSFSSDQEIKEAFELAKNKDTSLLIQEIEQFSFIAQAQINNFLKNPPKKYSIRVFITVTNNINQLIKERKLIEDLTDQLKKFEVLPIPSLNQRQEDIPLLVEHFIKNSCEVLGTKLKTIDINTLDFIVRREWKENVRELKSVIERSVSTSSGDTIELPESLVNESAQLQAMIDNIKQRKRFSFDKSLYNLEKTLIERTLKFVGDNQSKTAEILNISEANLRYRLKKFHIISAREK